jgi:hypothetical protein
VRGRLDVLTERVVGHLAQRLQLDVAADRRLRRGVGGGEPLPAQRLDAQDAGPAGVARLARRAARCGRRGSANRCRPSW